MTNQFSTLFILLIVGINSFGQLSRGGFPLEVDNLKSAILLDKTVRLPSFNLKEEEISNDELKTLKSIKFAHSFPVSLSAENAGTWYETDGYRVWQLIIESKGAYSLNIIFSKYHIPEGARLFVFDPAQNIILGAFTHENNKPYKKLAIYPLPGDQLMVQYEEPFNAAFRGELEIGEINHDYKGVFSMKNRFDRRFSDWCNVDVNCELESGTELQRRSVCRIIAGDELGSGTLLNNTLNNGKPYLLSAFHVYDDEETANIALYDFNYESPFCTGVNGSDIQSVSGSVACAAFDSIDLMLVELSEMPPPVYRPYLSGWDATKLQPYNSYVIHHPNGDTKKISHDSGKCDSVRYNTNFIKNGHWKVYNWESGTTEGGSSGAGLFNNDKRVVGILSGGNASCDDITFDLFSRFDKLWNYRAEANRQLKHWLDPGTTGNLRVDGLDPYISSSVECSSISNFIFEDIALILPVSEGTGYYSGNNDAGITEVAERFTGYKRAVINGIALGISDLTIHSESPYLTIRIYTGNSLPVFAEKQFKFSMKNLIVDAMNYLSFPEKVEVEGDFFVSVVIPDSDSLIVFQSGFRPLVAQNSLLALQKGIWKPMTEIADKPGLSASLLTQVMVCDASIPGSNDTIKNNDFLFRAFPNPASQFLVVEFKSRDAAYECWIYDMTGRLMLNECFENRLYGELKLSALSPGLYLIRVSNGVEAETKRIAIN
jgi:hypothetical protein